MDLVEKTFSKDDVVAFAVNDSEPLETVRDYLQDSGAAFPVLIDNPEFDHTCRSIPNGEESLADHFRRRVGNPEDGPFPLQIVIGADRRFAYLEKRHLPELLVSALKAEAEKARALRAAGNQGQSK